ncbi:MAG: hypothetical protein FWF53_02755 [Candidatus Azobacteroides sp.]|nr:hypothetical protein [Candidatus Azobacteroides sp.]
MKRCYFLFIVLILSISNTFAQGCYEITRKKGIDAYYNGKYKEAKKHFQLALSNCDDKPANNDLSVWIKKCDNHSPKSGGGTQTGPQGGGGNGGSGTVIDIPPITLTVSPKSISFDASGDQVFPVSISTNASDWSIQNEIAWCNVIRSSLSSVRLVCQPNLYETARSGFFYIIADDKKELITVKQEAAEDPVELGNKLYKAGKYGEARKLYMVGDESGSAEAPYRLGKMSLEGAGVVISRPQAMAFFKRSADRGYSRGENALGYMYETQEYPDYPEAVKWYRKSAEKGYAIAQYNLGMMYQYGLGVKKSKGEAKKWFKKSAKQGLSTPAGKIE